MCKKYEGNSQKRIHGNIVNLLITRKIQIETTMIYHFMLIQLQKNQTRTKIINNLLILNAGKPLDK